jgi:hypothetical protein
VSIRAALAIPAATCASTCRQQPIGRERELTCNTVCAIACRLLTLTGWGQRQDTPALKPTPGRLV